MKAFNFSVLESECLVVNVGRMVVVVVVDLGFDLVVIRFRNSVRALDLFDADATGWKKVGLFDDLFKFGSLIWLLCRKGIRSGFDLDSFSAFSFCEISFSLFASFKSIRLSGALISLPFNKMVLLGFFSS